MQHILVINIENSATCFGSIEPSSGQIQDTALVYSASAYTVWDPTLCKHSRCWSWSGQTTTKNAPAAPLQR